MNAYDGERKAGRFRRPGPWSVVPNFVLSDRRLRQCSTTARFLYTLGWIFSNHNRTDGTIEPPDFATLAASMRLTLDEVLAAAKELALAKLWEDWNDGIFLIPDYWDWCYSAETIERRAADTRERVRKFREKVPPDPLQNTEVTELTEEPEVNRSQQVRTGVRNALQETDAPIHVVTPGELIQRQRSVVPLDEINERVESR